MGDQGSRQHRAEDSSVGLSTERIAVQLDTAQRMRSCGRRVGVARAEVSNLTYVTSPLTTMSADAG